MVQAWRAGTQMRGRTKPWGPVSSSAPTHRCWARLGTASRTRTRGFVCKYWTWGPGPCAGREGCGSVSTGWNLKALAGNPMNAFLIFSFSFIFIIYLTQPPPPSFNPFMFSESASLCRLYPNLCVPSDAFLLGEIKYLCHRACFSNWSKGGT